MSSKNITRLSDQIDHTQLNTLNTLIEAGEEALEAATARQEFVNSGIHKLGTSIAAKNSFVKAVKSRLNEDSLQAAELVLEQGRALLAVMQEERDIINEEIRKIKENINQSKSIIARFEIERYREQSQLVIAHRKSLLSVEPTKMEEPHVVDNADLARQVKALGYSVDALIRLREKN